MRLYKVSWIHDNGTFGSKRVMAATGWAAKQYCIKLMVHIHSLTVEEIER
jgi:hypothetical protein